MPTLLRDVVRRVIDDEPDMEIVDEAQRLEELAETVRRACPDVVLVAAKDGSLPCECVRVMYEPPLPRVLSVSPDGRNTAAYRLVPERGVMGEVTPEGLADALRALRPRVPDCR
jgi:DNA-binding NarL/FixJ family response regulator